MPHIVGLGYIGLATSKLDDWRAFTEGVLGMTVLPPREDGLVRVRMDNHDHRIALRPASHEGVDFIGWELADEASFDEAITLVEAEGIDVRVIRGREALEARAVAAYASFVDPAGMTTELFFGASIHGGTVHNRYGAAFVTGRQGIGHVFVMVDNFVETCSFYERLGFRVRDRAAGGDFLLYGCGPREHSFGLGDVSGSFPLPAGLQHMMVQVDSLDAVGRAYDACLDGGAHLATTLGRHSNDHMFSFYMKTPGTFEMEYGYGGIVVERDADWVVGELADESLWGHRPFADSAEAQLTETNR